MRKIILALIAAVMLCSPSAAADSEPVPVVGTTLPWISAISRFLVGSTLEIEPLGAWQANGTIKRVRAPKGEAIIALDPKDASANGIAAGDARLHPLYENFPVRDSKRASLPYDPSVLPFLSQRLLVVISELSPTNYQFYQRRLAEFQSRLESTLEVGRSLIGGAKILDLTGACGPWVRGAARDTARPPEELWAAWLGSTRTGELKAALSEARSRGMLVLIDAWTPAVIRGIAQNEQRLIEIEAPSVDRDFFDHLHDIFLAIREKL